MTRVIEFWITNQISCCLCNFSFLWPLVLKCCYYCYFHTLQSFPPTIWFRLVAGLNAQLRLVRRGHLRTGFRSIMSWLETHGNPTLSAYGVRVDLASFQPTACGYHQFGLIVSAVEDGSVQPSVEGPYESLLAEQQSW